MNPRRMWVAIGMGLMAVAGMVAALGAGVGAGLKGWAEAWGQLVQAVDSLVTLVLLGVGVATAAGGEVWVGMEHTHDSQIGSGGRIA